jgi:hypothetical protein
MLLVKRIIGLAEWHSRKHAGLRAIIMIPKPFFPLLVLADCTARVVALVPNGQVGHDNCQRCQSNPDVEALALQWFASGGFA